MADDASAPIRVRRGPARLRQAGGPGGRFRPFCSARCRQVDLGRWLAGRLRHPGPSAGTDQGSMTTTSDVERVDRPERFGYFPRPLPAAPRPRGAAWAQVAQLVEHATENRSVGGSIPPLGTISPKQIKSLAAGQLRCCGSAGLAQC